MWKYVANAVAGILVAASAFFLVFSWLGFLGVIAFLLSAFSLADTVNFPRIMNMLLGFFVVWAAVSSFHSGWLFLIFGVFIFFFSAIMALMTA